VPDELADLRLFVDVVRAGSLSEAARKTRKSLTSISRRLSGLENRFEAQLIDRGSRRFKLTEEGALLLERATAVISAADDALSEVRTYRKGVKGNLRISAPIEIGRREIATICAQFARSHPSVLIDLSLSDARPDLIENRLDLSIQTKRPTGADIVQRKLLRSRRVICAAPSYLKRRGIPGKCAELTAHDCILMRRQARVYDRWTVRTEEGVRELIVPRTFVCDSTEVIHAWALAGAGIAVKALWDIEDDLKEGRLVEILPESSCDEIGLYVAYYGQRHTPSRIRLFIDFLVERLRAE